MHRALLLVILITGATLFHSGVRLSSLRDAWRTEFRADEFSLKLDWRYLTKAEGALLTWPRGISQEVSSDAREFAADARADAIWIQGWLQAEIADLRTNL